jgi:hypothetical protein
MKSGERMDARGIGLEGVEVIAEDILDGVEVFGDAIGKGVLAKRFPEVRGGVEFWAVRRQKYEAKIVGES